MKSSFLLISTLFITLLSCKQPKPVIIDSGVSHTLAQERFKDISELTYHLKLTIADSLQNDILGKATISLVKKNSKTPLILDFVSTLDKVSEVLVNNKKAFFSLENEHLIIPSRFFTPNTNKVEISFILGNSALNRNPNYFYSLFVPARARTAIPCFDQPDLKASVSYTISMPKSLTAVTNGLPYYYEDLGSNRKRVRFESTQPISTYLWAFAVGEFKKTSAKRNGREISIYHLEQDSAKVATNIPAIFEQVFHSIKWMEDYTGVDFPFAKYDLLCIPSFQFAGMEHPGAIYYRSELLFLSDKPTQKQLLRRAQLLAHETAHIWFGDLVTMKWFGGVWQKEVFANFMADKIVEEQFPELNHKLTFLSNHFPASYAVDRTIGANPIQQNLDNLNDAGSMYGNIIYHKAPIMMNQLENLSGAATLRKGLGMYLKKYAYANATWADLIDILNDLSEYDLALWSNTWVNEAGRPLIEYGFEKDHMVVHQQPEYLDSSKVWAQQINFAYISGAKRITEEVEILSAKTSLHQINKKPDFILPTIDESGYGLFLMDDASLKYAINKLYLLPDELMRAALLVQLYENFLYAKIHPSTYLDMLQVLVLNEDNEQVLALACGQLTQVFWRFTTARLRMHHSKTLEDALLSRIRKEESPGTKKMLFEIWSNVVTSAPGIKKLHQIITEGKVEEVSLSESDLSDAVFNLALKDPTLNSSFLISFADTLKDTELRDKIYFMSRVFSQDQAAKDSFVADLGKIENRRKENWVLTAIAYLHHPFLQEQSMKYLPQALALSESIKETGDIFFPIGWLNNSLRGYGSLESMKIIEHFLKKHPNYPDDLRLKLLQSADMVKRSSTVKNKYLK
ncbi:aminopeptidase N [Saccharicrinis carchari]|uniref:Aminopeptidase N n=1 Tax=Saccharicrinis carchari TaxID=1168039 RepID=A0A521ELH0_SACCC|nr:M1 family aminopeptidase [Saccharicrinis carchari]SMO84757.1 aminopeptidase N [Saccharicrinis carchari]